MILETERLFLRPWKESDAADLYDCAKNPKVGPPAGWAPHESAEYSLFVINNILNGCEAYAICLKSDKKPIGAAELMLKNRFEDNPDECELGFWLAEPFWGQGLIPEASRELLRRAFEDLNMRKVWCAYYDGNEKSKRVQEKLGFKYRYTNENVAVPALNEIRTEHINCITKEEWERTVNKKSNG